MDPVKVLEVCNIQPSYTVADFGAGNGFVARAAAAMVPQGQVFAIEINRELVTRLTREVQEHHIANLHVLWGDIELAEGTKLAKESTDLVICFNVLFLLEDKLGVLREAYRVLKPGGRIVIADWTDSFGGLGPRADHVFVQASAEALLDRVGFKKINSAVPAGQHHYAILFEK